MFSETNGNLVGLDAERRLNHPHGAVAVVAVDRLFAKLGRFGNPNDGWRATVGSVPDPSVVCQPQLKRKRFTSERTGVARHNQALAPQLR
jgi:hypothetical protein